MVVVVVVEQDEGVVVVVDQAKGRVKNKKKNDKMAEGTKIRVCVVDGLYADLAKTGVPLSVYCCNSKDF